MTASFTLRKIIGHVKSSYLQCIASIFRKESALSYFVLTELYSQYMKLLVSPSGTELYNIYLAQKSNAFFSLCGFSSSKHNPQEYTETWFL